MNRGQVKKKAIISAVIRVIGERGVSAVTHREIARLAGVSLSATTYYFKSRDDMIESAFISLIEEGISNFNRFILELKTGNNTIEEVFTRYMNEMAGVKSKRRINYIAIMELMLESSRNTKYRGIIKKYSSVHIDLLKMMLKKQYRDPFSIFTVQSLMSSLVFQQMSLPDRKVNSELLRMIVGRYFDLRGLKRL
jgi:TetR/AcrR family transcriptional regulator, regulator of biofilm formation and stress response